MKHPKINVLITIFNAEKYIKKCIQSLIDQSYKNWEAIIIDDKSTDKSIKIIKNNFKYKRLKITKLKKKNWKIKSNKPWNFEMQSGLCSYFRCRRYCGT